MVTEPTSRSDQPDGMLRFNRGRIESVIVAVLVREPALPVIETVNVPMLAAPLAVRVNVLVLVVLVGLKDAVTPLGKPDADKLTLPLKPFRGTTVIVLVARPPGVTVTLVGNAESV